MNSDFVVRSTYWDSCGPRTLDLVIRAKELPWDEYDCNLLIPRGTAEAKARRAVSQLWGCNPISVRTQSQNSFFSLQAAYMLSPAYVVAWDVNTGGPEGPISVLRPITAVSRCGAHVLVAFQDGEQVRFPENTLVPVALHHPWSDIIIEFDRSSYVPLELKGKRVEDPYSDRYPGEQDRFARVKCVAPPPPPPLPPLPPIPTFN